MRESSTNPTEQRPANLTALQQELAEIAAKANKGPAVAGGRQVSKSVVGWLISRPRVVRTVNRGWHRVSLRGGMPHLRRQASGNRPGRTWAECWRGRRVWFEENGAIAVCCDLSAAPGPALQRLIAAPSREEAVRQICCGNPRDALPALQLARTLETCRVFLLSRLDPGLVEDLEMIPIEGPEELVRLTRRNRSCLVLADAMHAMVHVENNV